MKRSVRFLSAFLVLVLLLPTLAGCVGTQGHGGEHGTQTEQGPGGSQGIQGDIGSQGPQGSQSEQKPTGSQGSADSQGPQGDKGEESATPTLTVSEDGYWVVNGVKTEYKALGQGGDDGITPAIEISSDGYWVINGVKTEHKAIGAGEIDGKAPTIEINSEGFWVVNGVVTTYKAISSGDGAQIVEISSDGYWIINGVKTEYKAIHIDGEVGEEGENGEDGKTPTVEISPDGYWVINGVKTEYKAVCDEDCPCIDAHSHNYAEATVILASTCTSMGVKMSACTVCGVVKYEFTAPKGHTYKDATVEPTCTDQGYTEHDCNDCDYIYRDTFVAKTEHSFGEWNVVFANCTTNLCVRTCTHCAALEFRSEAVSNHAYEISTTPPTCTEDGYILTYCDLCGYLEIESLYATGHTIEDAEIYEEPTCTDYGFAIGHCTSCDGSIAVEYPATGHKDGEICYLDDYCGSQKLGYVPCEVCDEIIYYFGHSYTVSIVNATCTTDGEIKYTCTHCGDVDTETIDAFGHIDGEWETETEATCFSGGTAVQHCMTCGVLLRSKVAEKTNHIYVGYISGGDIVYDCSLCSHSYTVAASETYHKITLDSKGGTEYGEIPVNDGATFELPVPEKEGWEFAGWYLDPDMVNLYTPDHCFYEDTVLYAGWFETALSGSIDSNNILTSVPQNFAFAVISEITLTNENISQHIFVEDAYGNSPLLYIAIEENGEYLIASDEYVAGEQYSVNIVDGLSFANSSGHEFWFIVDENNHCNISYKDGVLFLSEQEIYSVYETDEDIYVFLREDMLDTGDVVVVYGTDEDDVLFSMYVMSEGTSEFAYVYQVTAADPESVFDEYDVYYEGSLDMSGMEFEEDLTETLTEEVLNSETYADFERTARTFASTYKEGGSEFKFKGIEIEPKFSSQDSKVTVVISVVAKFARVDAATDKELDSFAITLKATFELQFTTVFSGSSVTNFSFVVNTDITAKFDIFASFSHSDKDSVELAYFKKLFNDSKENGKFDELENSPATAKKEIKIGAVTIPLPGGFSVQVAISDELSLDIVGEIGISVQVDMSVSIGLSYSTGDGISLIKSFKANASATAYLLGKIEAAAITKITVTASFLGLVNVYANVSIGPYFEMGGMVSASVSTGGGAAITVGGYMEMGTKVDANIGANAKLQIKVKIFRWKIDKTLTLFDKEWKLYSNKFPVFSMGSKEVDLYFSQAYESVSGDYTCGGTLDITELIDKEVVVQSLTEMSLSTKEAECTYYLEGDYEGIDLTDEGLLTVEHGDFETMEIKIKVVSGNIHKHVTLTLTLQHVSEEIPAVDPEPGKDGLTAGVICAVCKEILVEQEAVPAQ